jgi:hypothetical protein
MLCKMAYLRSHRFVVLALSCALAGCSDDGEPQGGASETGTDDGVSASGATADPTVTTTQSTSITTGDDDDSADDAQEDGGGTTGGPVTADDAGATTDDGATFDDDGESSDGALEESSSGGPSGTGPGETGETDVGEDAGTTGPLTPVGMECRADGDCESGVCWDFADYDRACYGTICSGECESDDDCIALATDAGAPSPELATCGDDGRCDLVGTGLGAFVCE